MPGKLNPFINAIVLIIISNALHASWNIAFKGRTTGPPIHTTYFLTPNNAPIKLGAKAYIGNFVNSNCVYYKIIDMGQQELRTGEYFVFDAERMGSLFGNGYTCMDIYYTYHQLIVDSIQLVSNGIAYTATIPAQTEIIIQ